MAWSPQNGYSIFNGTNALKNVMFASGLIFGFSLLPAVTASSPVLAQQRDLRCLRTDETYQNGGYRSPYYALVSIESGETLSYRLTKNSCDKAIQERNGNLLCFPSGETYKNGGYRSPYYVFAIANGKILSTTLTKRDCYRELNS